MDVPDAADSVALVGWRTQPPVANAINEFFLNACPDGWITVSKVAETRSNDGDIMALCYPPSSELVGPKLHPVFGRAGIVVDQGDVHGLGFSASVRLEKEWYAKHKGTSDPNNSVQ